MVTFCSSDFMSVVSTSYYLRYLAIVHALHYSTWVTPTRVNALLVCLWILAFCTFFIPLPTKQNFIYYQYSPSEMMCGLYWEYPWFCVITAVYIPVLSGMYDFIYCQSLRDDVWTLLGVPQVLCHHCCLLTSASR